jgi:predicted RNase H-like HicB family nuclease
MTMATSPEIPTRRFKVILEWDATDDVWVSLVPTLGYLSTYGDTRQEALDQTREAIIGYLEAAEKEGMPTPTADSDAEIVELEVAGP